jgi:peroxiredoxin
MSLFKAQAPLRIKFAKMLDLKMTAIMDNHIELLRAEGAVEKVIQVGAKAPSFTLKDGLGNSVSSDELLKRGPLVVVFNRGNWCPYCNEEVKAFNQSLAEFKKLNTSILVISPQKAALAEKQQKELNLGFSVLVDQENRVAKSYGVAYEFTTELKNLYLDEFENDVSKHNESAHWELPMPARILIGKDGIVKEVLVEPDYRFSAEIEETLEAVKTLSH